MNHLGPALFYLCSLIAVAGALGTVVSRNAIRSAMGLLACVFGIAGLYLTLSAQLLAAVQVIVYAGAVVVLFMFVIMILGPTTPAIKDSRTTTVRALAAGLFALGVAGTMLLLRRADTGGPHLFDKPRSDFGSVAALGRAVFTDGVVTFEVAGVLLLVAIVGVMAIARGARKTAGDKNTPSGGSSTSEVSS